MALSDQQFDHLYGAIRARIDSENFVSRRERLVERERLRPLLEEGAAFLNRSGRAAIERDRDQMRWLLRDHLRSRQEEFGVPVWVFAIFLKIAVSILIDWWLLHGEDATL